MAASLVGRTLGKYKIVEELGHGGMATVYLGYQEDVGRHVAVKVLPPHPGQSDQFVERFRLEARTIARLQHPHILPLYDYGDQDDVLFLVTPYIEGGTLRERIEDGPLPLDEVAHYLRQISSALDFAHKNGVIHRDIKPGNVLLSGEGNASLADFGIVRMVEGGAGLTATDGVIGTPAYMSPEQGQGLPVDTCSDVYSLGSVVYEMVSGELPYSAETPMQILLKHISEPLPNIMDKVAGLPMALEPVMLRALAKDPPSRYQTASEFAADFTAAIQMSSNDDVIDTAPEIVRPVLATSAAADTATGQPSTQPAVLPTATVAEPIVAPTAAGGRSRWLMGAVALMVLSAAVMGVLAVLTGRPAGNTVVVMGVTDVPAVTLEPQQAVATEISPPTAIADEVAVTIPTVGTMRFATTNEPGDTVNLSVTGLTPPGDGELYAVWLTHTEDSDLLLALGQLPLDAFGDGVLSFTAAEGQVLPAFYNQVVITQETTLGDAPDGEVAYQGAVPVALTTALHEILVGSEDERGLLAAAMAEADFAARHAGLASGSSDIGGLQTHTEHTLNILLGTEDDLNGDGRPQNPGLGLGLVPVLDSFEAQLAAVTTDDGEPVFMAGLENMRVCVQNVQEWAGAVETLGHEILAADDFAAATEQAERSTEQAVAMITGVDLNNNGQVEAFEGECGLVQIADYGVLAGNMTLVAAEQE